MLVRARSLDEERRVTADAALELANVLATPEWGAEDVRAVLIDHDFIRARHAPTADLDAFATRYRSVARLLDSLPGGDLAAAVDAVNEELADTALHPTLIEHDGAPLHIHWTGPETSFAERVVVDILMAIGQLLCEDGTERFGRCAAESCARLFFDPTKNRSKRFCSDPRCASRTHTAEHRARKRRTPPG